MDRNEILVFYGKEIARMTEEALKTADLKGQILDKCGSFGAKIALKPNLLGPVPASEGATTHPEITEAVIRYLQKNGFSNLCVMEGSWVGDRTEDSLLVCGYDEMLGKLGVPFYDLQKDRSREVDCAGMRIRICMRPLEADFLISLPVMKGHCQTRMTCALKNMKGCLPNPEKRRFHRMGLFDPIGHLAAGLRQDFILTDSICSDLTFEDGGNPVQQDRIFVSRDPVLNDAYCLRLMHIRPEEVPYIRIAETCGAGSSDLSGAGIRVLREKKEADGRIVYAPDHPENGETGETREDAGEMCGDAGETSGDTGGYSETGNGWQDVVHVREMVNDVDSCSACYGTLIPVLRRLSREGYDVSHLRGICIGQGFRGKTGDIGIGTCTSCFRRNLPGCPPETEEMYRFLEKVLTADKLS